MYLHGSIDLALIEINLRLLDQFLELFIKVLINLKWSRSIDGCNEKFRWLHIEKWAKGIKNHPRWIDLEHAWIREET